MTFVSQRQMRGHASWRRRPQGLKLVDVSPADVLRTWHRVSGDESDAGARWRRRAADPWDRPVKRYADAGFDGLVLQNARPHPDGFLDFYD